MRTPKQSFLTSGHASVFSKLVAYEAFEPACQYALLQLQSEMAPTTVPGIPCDPYIGLDSNSQMYGARRVLEILSSISEPIKEKSSTKKDTLNYA